MTHTRRLQRAVRHAFYESGNKEMLDLVDAEPAVRASHSGLAVDEIDGEAETEKVIHVDRLRVGFVLAPVFAARPAAATRLRFDDCLAADADFFLVRPPVPSPLSRAQK